MMDLFIIRVEHSQTHHEFIGVWAESAKAAISLTQVRYPKAYYWSLTAMVDKIL